MKTYSVEWDPRNGEPNAFYVKMTDAQVRDLRGLFTSLQKEKVLNEWSVDGIDDLGISYREFIDQEVDELMQDRPKKPKDWFPGSK